MILELLITLSSLIFIYFKVFRKNSLFYDKNGKIKPKKASYMMIIKTMYQFIFHTKREDRLDFFKKIHRFSPKFLRIKFWKFDYVAVYDPDILKKVFNSQAACQRPFRNCFQLEKGLLASEYHYWRTSRKHLNSAFNLNVLKGFIPIFSHYAHEVVKDMESHLDGKEFDILFPLAKLTARSVAATVCNVHGVEVSSYDRLIESIAVFLDVMFKRMVNPLLQIDAIFKLTKDYQRDEKAREFTMNYGDDLIATSRDRKKREEDSIDENGNPIEKKDAKVEYIIDQLVNHEEKFTNQEIREHLMILMITASETSARFLATTLVYLAIYQDIQQKVYEEIHEIFGDEENIDLDFEKLGQLKYLDNVLKESLRLFTPVPITARETIDKLDIGIGEPLEKGAKIILFNYVLHRRRDIWGKNADKFDPENFSPENVSSRDAYAFVPFGAGPRNCIGNRFAMFAAKTEALRFLKAFKFSTSLKESEIKMGLSLTGQLTVDHMVSIEKRN